MPAHTDSKHIEFNIYGLINRYICEKIVLTPENAI